MRVGFRFKALFFNSAAVIKAVDKGTRAVLGHFGGFVRKVARRSMRKGKGASPPGKPPKVHTGLIKNFLFYGFDPAKRSVVVGPALVRMGSRRDTLTVPELQEEGGSRRTTGGETLRYPARPFMEPAFDKGIAAMDNFWRDSITK